MAIKYGYWWWIPAQGYQARGWGGQYIIVRPDMKMVVVVTGEAQRAIFQYLDPYIFQAVSDEGLLPPNPKAASALSRVLDQLERPPAQAVGPMPEIAAKVSGKEYALEPNTLGLRSFVLTFKNGREGAMKMTIGKLALDFPVGLDGNFRVANTGISLGTNSEQSLAASKGSWVNANTFAFKFHILGDVVTQIFSMKFTDDEVTMDFGNAISSARIAGKMRKQG
jgi:hypothetical protein